MKTLITSWTRAWRSPRGVAPLFYVIAIGLTTLTTTVSYYYVRKDVDSPQVRADLKACIDQIKAAQAGLEAVRAQLIAPCLSLDNEDARNACIQEKERTHELAFDDPNYQRIRQCQALLASIANAPSAKGQELSTLVNNTVGSFALGACSMEDVPQGTAGVAFNPTIKAHIPFGGDSGKTAVNMTGAVGVPGGPLTSQGGGNWLATLHVTADESKDAAGQQSSVNVSASTPFLVSNPDGSTRKFFPTPSNPCPAGSTPNPGDNGACAITCSVSKSFTWKPGALGTVKLTASTDKIFRGSGASVELTAQVENAKSAAITGVGTVNGGQGLKKSTFTVKPTETTSYTLLAIPVTGEPKSDRVTVTVLAAPVIAITSPASDTTVTSDSVTVTGTVSPVPEGGASVRLGINGGQADTVTVDGSGRFTGTVKLTRTVTQGDIVLSNPSVLVERRGHQEQPVTVEVTRPRSDFSNSITATLVTPALNPAPSSGVAVVHAARVTRFVVNWTSCPPLNKNEGRSSELTGGGFLTIGTVECGHIGHEEAHANCGVTASVQTSVGAVSKPAVWTFDIGPE